MCVQVFDPCEASRLPSENRVSKPGKHAAACTNRRAAIRCDSNTGRPVRRHAGTPAPVGRPARTGRRDRRSHPAAGVGGSASTCHRRYPRSRPRLPMAADGAETGRPGAVAPGEPKALSGYSIFGSASRRGCSPEIAKSVTEGLRQSIPLRIRRPPVPTPKSPLVDERHLREGPGGTTDRLLPQVRSPNTRSTF